MPRSTSTRAKLWYNSKRAGVGDELVNDVGRTVLVLSNSPEGQALYYKGFRRVLLRRYPYKIFYRIEGEKVIVFRIPHFKRDHRRHL